MIDCRNVHHLVATGRDEELGLMKRLELKLHLMMCRHCSRYVAQMRSIGEAIRRLCSERPEDAEDASHIEREVLAAVGGNDGKGT